MIKKLSSREKIKVSYKTGIHILFGDSSSGNCANFDIMRSGYFCDTS
jgi:hypothetical protein